MAEVTIVLYYVFDLPMDKIVYDNVSGYSNSWESEHDFLYYWTYIHICILACGLAKARDLKWIRKIFRSLVMARLVKASH